MRMDLINSNGATKTGVKYGFSWTLFFFGPFVPLFRGDIKWLIIMLILAPLTFGIAGLIFPFIYNRIYISNLLEKGYYPSEKSAEDFLILKGMISKK